jgi:NADH dehydrogenase
MSDTPLHRVVIVGGGFGGLQASLALARMPVSVTLVDRRNFHLFQPLLYQIATGALSPANIAVPLRALFKRRRNVRVLLDEAIGLDPAARTLRLRHLGVPYDTLIIAGGARHHYFGHAEWEPRAPGLKTIEDATTLRARIFTAFEAAELEADEARRAALLTFVVVGGGPTGVELAGALAEIARHTLPREFRSIDTASARILLVEAGPRVLSTFHESQSQRATADLTRLGVTVRTGVAVADVRDGSVLLRGPTGDETVEAATVLWGAGVQGAPIGRVVAEATGAALDRAGRVAVGEDCSVAGHPEVFVIGDLAHVGGVDAPPLPGVAPVAMQQGTYVAELIRARLDGRTLPPFRYRDPGTMATIGRRLAVAQIGKLRLTGTLAWLAWLFVHLMALVRFESRLLVLTQWAWHYVSWNRNARLITLEALPGAAQPRSPTGSVQDSASALG